MKNRVSQLLPKGIRNRLIKFRQNFLGSYASQSYSQEGEDMILKIIFGHKKTGFYVDVGAHHPKRFSNTFYFYKKGWRGINIDAMPGSMKAFKKYRSSDINLEVPISNSGQTLTYYSFNDPALNGFSKEISKARENNNSKYFIQQEIKLKTYRLAEILDQNLPEYERIDFMSIDVEGFDFEVLKSNNWDKYKPRVLLIEIFGKSWSEIVGNEIAVYLNSFGYNIIAKTINTVIFVQENK